MHGEFLPTGEEPMHQLGMGHVVHGLSMDMGDQVVGTEAGFPGGGAFTHGGNDVLD